jgi:hypothetical protein
MSTALDAPQRAEKVESAEERAPVATSTAGTLEDHVPPALRFPRVLAGFVALVGAVFWIYSYQRLHHTDLWGHLAYGRLLCATQALPATEPLMPLAQGMPFVDTSWLAQVVGYRAVAHWGPPGMQFLHAATIATCFALLAWGFYHRTRHFMISAAGLALFETLNWYQFQIVRPQMAGLVCFVVVLAMLSARRWRPLNWGAIPLTFAVWANLHGSFVVGLALVACACLGRAIDVGRRTRRLAAPFRDVPARRLLLILELAAVAALLNPYGLRLYAEVLTFSENPNLRNLIEWDPLSFRTMQGQLSAATALALAIVYRLSPRRVSAGEILALVAFGGAALWSARMLIWWTPIAGGCFVIHAQAAWRRFFPLGSLLKKATVPLDNANLLDKAHLLERDISLIQEAASVRSGKWTVVTVGLAWIFFAWTPFGIHVLHGRVRGIKDSVSRATPVAAVAWLREHPPAGLVFNVFEWGDYLIWAGPPDVKVFVTSHAHLVPREIWRDYLSVINLSSGWNDVFDRYDVQTLVLDKSERGALISNLRENKQWKRSFEDELAVIFTRQAASAEPSH